MSPRRTADSGGGGGKVGVTALLLVVAAVGMLLLVRARPDPEPFDPRSGADSGTRGLVLLLERQGADVQVVRTVPSEGSGRRVLVLQDRLNDQQRAELLAFVEAGGVVVMADADSQITDTDDEAIALTRATPIVGEVPADNSTDVEDQLNVPLRECTVPSVTHLRGVFVDEGSTFAGSPSQRCFGDATRSFLVTQRRGDGLIVQLGDNVLFTNARIRYADNGPLATALLAPADGAQVSILLGAEAAKTTADLGSGEDGLTDLVRPGVWMALAQLAIGFVVFAIARAIRPGRPVREPEQVPIAGSELVVATGNLMQRAHHSTRAGWLLRGNLYRALCRRFHVSPTISVEQLDAAVAARTAVPAGQVAAVLSREVHDNEGLLRLSNSLQEIRQVALVGGPGATANGEGADDER